jgi:branched-chain amino acid transport system substrate-binding protein
MKIGKLAAQRVAQPPETERIPPFRLPPRRPKRAQAQGEFMHKSRLVLLAGAALIAASSVASAEDVKFGVLFGFTGPLEQMSPPMAKAVQLVATQVNAQGGILKGGKLSFAQADDTCTDATAATNAADRLVNSEKVVAIVGAMCSGVTIAIANTVAVPAGVVMISPSATAPSITTLNDKDLVFRTSPSDAYQGDVLARLLLKKNIKDVAITYVNNDYGKGLADSLAAAYKAAGGKVAANVSHEEGKADYRAELGQLAASGSQNLVILAYASGSGNTVLRQAVESGNFKTYIGGDGMVGDALFTGIDKKAVENMIATKPGSPKIPSAAAFKDLATKAGVDPTAVYSPESYDAAFLLALAVQKKGSATRDGLTAALRAVTAPAGMPILPGEWDKAVKALAAGQAIKYQGASGPLDFDKNGDVPGTIVEMTVKNGSFAEVGQAT